MTINTTHEICDQLFNLSKEASQLLGSQLKQVILYGSFARGEQSDNSDIDLLYLIDSPSVKRYQPVTRSLRQLERKYSSIIGNDIEGLIGNVKYFYYWIDALPFNINVNKDGIILYSTLSEGFGGNARAAISAGFRKCFNDAKRKAKRAHEILDEAKSVREQIDQYALRDTKNPDTYEEYNDYIQLLCDSASAAYYAVYKAIQSSLVIAGDPGNEHKATRNNFKKYYIDTGIVTGAYLVDTIYDVAILRNFSDYTPGFEGTEYQVELSVKFMDNFLQGIEKLLQYYELHHSLENLSVQIDTVGIVLSRSLNKATLQQQVRT